MKCSIIIPVYNNANFTKAALEDLVKLGDGCEIIIIDNGSQDDTFDVVEGAKSTDTKIQYIKNESNCGFSKANNQGYDISVGEYVLFLNNDIRVKDDGWLDMLIEQCDDDCIVGAQAGMIDRNYDFIKEGYFDPMQKGAYLSGWCMLAKRSTWERLKINEQIWNKIYFLYFEDDDLSWRAKQIGIKLKVIKDLPLVHFSRTTGRKYNMFHFFHKSKRIFKKTWKGKLI